MEDERPLIHTDPEFAVAETDVHVIEGSGAVIGTSLWKDAWRRLLKNKLAVFGLIVVVPITVVSLIGPLIIKAATGYTYDFIPNHVVLTTSLPPLSGREVSSS